MPAIFDRSGIRFQYPENWDVDEQESFQQSAHVTVYAPGGGFWSVALHPSSSSPEDLVKAAAAEMKREYDCLDVEPSQAQVAGNDSVGYEINFICLDLLSTARVHSFSAKWSTCVVMYQAEDREFERLEPVFRAISHSLTFSE